MTGFVVQGHISYIVLLVPAHGRVSKAWWGQLSWFSSTCMTTACERAWRPTVSKLRPSRHVSWQELHWDHSVRWQSPEDDTQHNFTSALYINTYEEEIQRSS